MRLSIIMPTYNEAGTLPQIIQKVIKLPLEIQLIIVDDGSTDNTKEVLEQYKDQNNIKILHHAQNKGKGSAIRTGRDLADGDIITIQDADLETEPNDLIELIKPIVEKKTKVVYGSRLLSGGARSFKYSWKYYLGGKFITLIANLLYHQNITDEPTCYKVFDSIFFKSIPLECTGFEFCPEITAKVSKMGEKIIELPMNYYPRDVSEGKKLRIKDGITALFTLIQYKFRD